MRDVYQGLYQGLHPGLAGSQLVKPASKAQALNRNPSEGFIYVG
jgi:hypothetical protein